MEFLRIPGEIFEGIFDGIPGRNPDRIFWWIFGEISGSIQRIIFGGIPDRYPAKMPSEAHGGTFV